MKKLRLALVSDAVLPFHHGGKETRHDAIMQRLAKVGVNVEIHTMHWWDTPGPLDRGAVRFRSLCKHRSLYNNGCRSLTQATIFALSGARMLFRRFDVMEADAVPIVQIFILRLVTWIRRRPLVTTWHEVWGRTYWADYLGRLGLLAAVLEWIAIRLPDRIVCPSDETAARIRKLRGARNVVVVPNGIDIAAIDAIRGDGVECDFLYVGRLVAHKNMDAVLHAIAQSRIQGSPMSLRVIGIGPEEVRLRRLTDDLGISDLVRFDGRMETSAEVIAAMKSAKAFISLSSREGFGIAVLEALASGLPVVALDHPNNHARSLIDHTNGTLVRDLAPASVVSVLTGVLAGRSEMGAAAHRSAAKFDWPAIADQMLKVYSS